MQEFIIKTSQERFEITEAVDKINDELYNKYSKKDKLDYLPILSYSFGQNYSSITLSIASENCLPEFSIWFSEKDDRIFYEKSNKYESFYSIGLLYWNLEAYQSHCKDYNEYQKWLSNRNTQRYTWDKGKITYDLKNIMHCRRLLNIALEISEKETFTVLRPEAKDLIEIRRGNIKIEDIMKSLEDDKNKILESFKSSKLPEKVDQKLIEDYLIKLRKRKMLVKETNEFKVILENPWLELNSKCTEDNLQMNKYPKIFSRIYKFETGEEIVAGDNIWRIVSEGNFRRNIRCVKFSINHLLMDIFPSYESANLELDRTIDIESKNQDFHNLKQILLYISVLSNTKDFDKKSLAEIKLNLDNINSLSKKYGN